MKLKQFAVAGLTSLAFLSPALSQERVQLAKVISVSAIETHERSLELSQPICTIISTPIQRVVPVVRDTQVRDPSAPALAALVGAVIANQAFRGSDMRAGATLLGASVGYAAADGYAPSRSIEYRTEIHYEQRESCRTEYVPVFRPVITGYRVTFIHRGVHTTVIMNSHPGEYVKIVSSTSYRVEP